MSKKLFVIVSLLLVVAMLAACAPAAAPAPGAGCWCQAVHPRHFQGVPAPVLASREGRF